MGVRQEVLELLEAKWGREQALLRLLLWERHGCPLSALRTTRGQCLALCDRCGIDFGNKTVQEIWDGFMDLRKGGRELK